MATLPRQVASMIAEELSEEESAAPPASEASEDGSEPLSLEPEVDAAVAEAKKTEHKDVSAEVAELRFLLERGFQSKAEGAFRQLIEAHPGHPDLVAQGGELKASKAAADAKLDVLATIPVKRKAKKPAADPESPSSKSASDPREDAAGPAKGDAATKETSSPDITVVTRPEDPSKPKAEGRGPELTETPTSPTFVEGTSPPPGGFPTSAAAPTEVTPNVTPRLGIQAPGRVHMSSSESLPTNPRMPKLDIDTTAVAKPAGVRLVMMGTGGEPVWDRLLAAGEMLEVGRDSEQPWGGDPHIEPSHARLFVIPGGGIRIEPMGRSGVYRQVDEQLAVRDGDEFRVGESLLRYSSQDSSRGAVTCYPMSGTTCSTVPIGASGLIIGRENADIEIPQDTFVSGAHCRFSCRDDGLFLEDMGSANGTYSRLRAGEAVPYGSLLLLGQTQFEVRRVLP